MFPEYWTEFLRTHSLVHRELSVPEESDLSGVGADLEIYDEVGARDEAENFYPGIAVAPDGFVPVAHCSIGSGDPYFINAADGPGGPLYRVYHDSVSTEGYDRSEAVAVVLGNFEDLLQYGGT